MFDILTARRQHIRPDAQLPVSQTTARPWPPALDKYRGHFFGGAMCSPVPLLVWFALGFNVAFLLFSSLMVWRSVREYQLAVFTRRQAFGFLEECQLLRDATDGLAYPGANAPNPFNASSFLR